MVEPVKVPILHHGWHVGYKTIKGDNVTSFKDLYDDSTYIAADDFPEGQTYALEVESVAEELIGQKQERKLVVHFKGAKKGLVLNKTNGKVLAGRYGDDTDRWAGAKIVMYTIWTEFQGEPKRGVRIRLADNTPDPAPTVQQFSDDALSAGDDLPF